MKLIGDICIVYIMLAMIIICIWVGVYFPSYFLSKSYLFLPNKCHRIWKHVFPSDLIILKSQGLDVILGMDWLAKYQGVIDCASRSITLRTPAGLKIKYVSKYRHKHAQVNSLKGVALMMCVL